MGDMPTRGLSKAGTAIEGTVSFGFVILFRTKNLTRSSVALESSMDE
jgi:hypothetical protein